MTDVPFSVATHPSARLTAPFCQSAAMVVALVDVSIMTRWVGGFIGPLNALISHLAVSAALCVLLILLHRSIRPQVVLMAALLVLLGPLGSFVLLIAQIDRPDRPSKIGALGAKADPHRTQTSPSPPVELVYASLRQGRRPRADASALTSYETVFLTGALRPQQQALAAISRGYRPEMLPALRVALSSDRPAVRVQAAAVYARLRGSFDERAKAALQRDTSELAEDARLALVAEWRDIAASGFVSPEIAGMLNDRSDLLLRGPAPPRSFMASNAPEHDPARLALSAPPTLKRHSCGGIA